MRLSSDAVGRFQREVDWASTQRDQQAMHVARRLLVELATAYLREGDAALDASDFLYWSREKIGIRSVVTVTHVAMHEPASSSPVAFMIGSRQIYASRYFDASLGLTAMFAAAPPSGGGGAFDLIYLNRSRHPFEISRIRCEKSHRPMFPHAPGPQKTSVCVWNVVCEFLIDSR